MVNMAIKQLVSYGVKNNLLSEDDVIYTINTLLDIMKLDSYEDVEETFSIETPEQLEEVLKIL